MSVSGGLHSVWQHRVGGQMVSATGSALIDTLETLLAVARVWICFNKTPSASSFVGGIIVMAAVAGHVWQSNRARVSAAT
jgi:glycerol-3-phosphate acyltransferase PlsY